MGNEKNHLYTLDDERRDRKNVNKKKEQQQYSRFSTSLATSVNNTSLQAANPALQIETRVQIGDPYDDTKGSVGASSQIISFNVYGSNYTFYEVTGDVDFGFDNLPTGRHIEFTVDILVNQVAGVTITFPQVTNPPTLAGNDGDRYILQFIGVLRSDLTGVAPPVATYTFLTGSTAGGVTYPIIWPSQTLAPAPAAVVNLDFSLNTGNAKIVQFPAGNITLGLILPPVGAFAEEMHVMFIQDGVGGRTFIAVPAAIKNGGLMNGLLDPLANAKTMFKFVTHDNGVSYHAELIDLAVGAGGTVPNGTAQYQHLEWNGAAWIAQQFLEFGANSAFAGELRFPNNVIGVSWSNQAHTGDLQLKVDNIFDYLDITNSSNGTVGIILRAQDGVDPDQIMTITQSPTTAGVGVITTDVELALDIGAFPKIRLMGADDIKFYENADNFQLFRASPSVINLGDLNALVYTTFGAGFGNTGKSISRFATGLHYDLEDSTHTHLFRVSGAIPADALHISATEVQIYSPLDFVPETDGTLNIGVAANSFNDINADRIIFRHNDGILSTSPSIGRSSNALRLNSPIGNAIELDIDGTNEYLFDSLGFSLKNLNSIFFLDGALNQDIQISYLDPTLIIKNNTATGGLIINQEATVPEIVLRGNNSADGLLAHKVSFRGESDTNIEREYANIKSTQIDTVNGNEQGGFRIGLIEDGVEDVGYLSANAQFQEVQIFKTLNMTSDDIIGMGGGTINLLTPDATPNGAADFVMTFDASANALRKVLLNNLPGGGGGVSFPIEPLVTDNGSAWTNPQTLDLSVGDGHVFKWTVDQDLTFAATVLNIPPSLTQRTFELQFVHDGVGGTFTVTLPNNFITDQGTAFTSFTISNGNTVILTARVNDGTNFLVIRRNVTAVSGGAFLLLAGGTMTGNILMSGANLDLNGLNDILLSADGLTKMSSPSNDIILFELGAFSNVVFGTASVDIEDKLIIFGEISTPGSALADTGRLYVKEVGGTHSELFYKDELGTETNIISTVGVSPPFDDNQDIIQDNLDNTKVWRMTLDPITTGSTKTFSFVGGGNATYTFQSASGLIAALDLAQSWSQIQTHNANIDMNNNSIIDQGNALPNGTGVSELGGLSNYWDDVFTESLTLRAIDPTTASTLNYITADSGGLIINTPEDKEITFRENGADKIRILFDGSGTDRAYIRAPSALEIGWMPSNTSLTVGENGTTAIPFEAGFESSAAQADTDFGNATGCCGFYMRSGADAVLFCVKAPDGDWRCQLINAATGGVKLT